MTVVVIEDLSDWVQGQLPKATIEQAAAVASYLWNRKDRPELGADWSGWLRHFDLWYILQQMETEDEPEE